MWSQTPYPGRSRLWDQSSPCRTGLPGSQEEVACDSEPVGHISQSELFCLFCACMGSYDCRSGCQTPVHSQGQDLVISYLPSFVAKTESVVNSVARSFIIKSLKDFAGDLPEGSSLGPVRLISCYIEKTRNIVNRPLNLFVSPRRPSRGISENAISFFIRKSIVDSGALEDVEGPAPRAHSVRGVATSAAFLSNYSISRVLEAASWKSNTVFSLFYF